MKSVCCQGLDVLTGCDGNQRSVVVGTISIGAQAKQYLVLHIDDPKGLVAKAKGAGIAWVTDTLVPEVIENKIYRTVAEEMQKEFKAKGSTVSVEITSSPPKGTKPKSDLLGGVLLGVLSSVLGYGVVKLLSMKRRS